MAAFSSNRFTPCPQVLAGGLLRPIGPRRILLVLPLALASMGAVDGVGRAEARGAEHEWIDLEIREPPLPCVLVSPPNGKMATGVMAIVPTQPNISPESAAGLAAFVARRLKGTKWRHLEIFVFKDKATANRFAAYQKPRRSAPLSPRDYRALRKLWPHALLRYEKTRSRESFVVPSQSPNDWWKWN